MTRAAEKYLAMERELMHGRMTETITDDRDDEISSICGDLWLKMTVEERAEAETRTRAYNRTKVEKHEQTCSHNSAHRTCKTCTWILTREHVFHTECGNIHGFPQGDGDLEGSDSRFCPYCGKPLNTEP